MTDVSAGSARTSLPRHSPSTPTSACEYHFLVAARDGVLDEPHLSVVQAGFVDPFPVHAIQLVDLFEGTLIEDHLGLRPLEGLVDSPGDQADRKVVMSMAPEDGLESRGNREQVACLIDNEHHDFCVSFARSSTSVRCTLDVNETSPLQYRCPRPIAPERFTGAWK